MKKTLIVILLGSVFLGYSQKKENKKAVVIKPKAEFVAELLSKICRMFRLLIDLMCETIACAAMRMAVDASDIKTGCVSSAIKYPIALITTDDMSRNAALPARPATVDCAGVADPATSSLNDCRTSFKLSYISSFPRSAHCRNFTPSGVLRMIERSALSISLRSFRIPPLSWFASF